VFLFWNQTPWTSVLYQPFGNRCCHPSPVIWHVKHLERGEFGNQGFLHEFLFFFIENIYPMVEAAPRASTIADIYRIYIIESLLHAMKLELEDYRFISSLVGYANRSWHSNVIELWTPAIWRKEAMTLFSEHHVQSAVHFFSAWSCKTLIQFNLRRMNGCLVWWHFRELATFSKYVRNKRDAKKRVFQINPGAYRLMMEIVSGIYNFLYFLKISAVA
jgi:hypothetical protein